MLDADKITALATSKLEVNVTGDPEVGEELAKYFQQRGFSVSGSTEDFRARRPDAYDA